jgi:hypothetical protein
MQQSKVLRVKQMEIGRDLARWLISLALNNVLPFGLSEEQILTIVRSIRTNTTALEVRRELDWLAESGWVEIRKEPGRSWFATLTQYAVNEMKNAHKKFHSEWD